MSQTTTLTGRCPHCGEELTVPGHLQEFSCMFCGERLSPDALRADSAPAAPSAAEAAEAAAYYKAHILEVITNHKGIDKQLSKSGYAPAIEQYAEANRATFVQLERALLGGALDLEAAVGSFLDQLDAQWTKDASNRPGKRRESLQDADKFTIAIFLVPMIRRLGLSCSDAFCRELHRQWMARYPKSLWQVGDYDTINNGFKKKFLGLCFITTAICQEQGKPDDCPELTAFRTFRDGYLRSCADGPQLIDDYYALAPSIVMAIEQTADPADRYGAIRRDWLEPCYAELQAGQLEACKNRYTAMVRHLEKEYLS